MIVFRTLCPSAHLNSLCRALHELSGDFMFTYQTDDPGGIRLKIGWKTTVDFPSEADSPAAVRRAEECSLLVDMLREIPLMETRAERGLTTVYVSERWFKPIKLPVLGYKHLVSGFLRVLSPSYFKMARRFVRLMENPNFWVFPTGMPGVRDFARLYGLFHGDWLCLFRAPKLAFERKAGGRVWMQNGSDGNRYGLNRMRVWGYFVDSSTAEHTERERRSLIEKILWCGTTIDWKRVDTLVDAWKIAKRSRPEISLLLIGEGQMDAVLRKMAGADAVEGAVGWVPGKVCFAPYQAQTKVRELMREADVYVMPSDGKEGWGAAVSDALAEGCPVISTYEAGSSATVLPESQLYHAGDAKALAKLLLRPQGEFVVDNDNWDGDSAAKVVVELFPEAKDVEE